MSKNVQIIDNFIEYLRSMIWRKENQESQHKIVDDIQSELVSLDAAEELDFDYEEYRSGASYRSLVINKHGEKVAEYFASADDGMVSVNIKGVYTENNFS